MPLGHHLNVQIAGIGRGAADGVVQVQLHLMPLARKFAQAAQCHLDVAGAQFLRVVIVAVGALVPHLHGAFVATFVLPYAYALRVVPVSAKWRGAASAYPFVAAFVSLFLLFQAFAQGFHQFVPTHFLDFGQFFRA